MNAVLTFSVFGSRYQPMLDGKPLGLELDLCQEGSDPLWMRFDLRDLAAGKHTLGFEGRGDSPSKRSLAAPSYAVGINCLILLRLEDMKGYHQVLNERSKK